jgi:hypothetical protein
MNASSSNFRLIRISQKVRHTILYTLARSVALEQLVKKEGKGFEKKETEINTKKKKTGLLSTKR